MASKLCSSGGGILIVDEQRAFSAALARSFGDIGYSPRQVTTPAEARQASRVCSPCLIVTELRVGPEWAFDFAAALRAGTETCPVVIATAYPSVATAVRAMRLGFEGYFAKPVSARTILEEMEDHLGPALRATDFSQDLPSLNRTMWEYINQVFASTGTISGAARRLGVDRRSFRRMLAKYPPLR